MNLYSYKAPTKNGKTGEITQEQCKGFKCTLLIGPYKHQFVIQLDMFGNPDKICHWQSGYSLGGPLPNKVAAYIGKQPSAKERAQKLMNTLVDNYGADTVLQRINDAPVINEKLVKVVG